MTYFSELNAQFAKEAMTDQSLDSDEIINVRCVILSLTCSARETITDAVVSSFLKDGLPKIRIQQLSEGTKGI